MKIQNVMGLGIMVLVIAIVTTAHAEGCVWWDYDCVPTTTETRDAIIYEAPATTEIRDIDRITCA